MIKQLTKKNMKTNKRINSILLLFIFGIMLVFSCTENKKDTLPYLGHHDIVHEATGELEVGDTIYHKVPSFEYLNQDSIWIKSSDIENKIWIAKFFFTNCPTICPPMTSAMKEVAKDLSEFEEKVVFLSFSIDPTKDNPARLREYIKEHDITAKNWHFLTGDEDETHDLGVHGFYIHAQADNQAPGGYAHSGNFVLVDKNQHIRGVYDGLEEKEREKLIKDFKKLLKNE